MGLTVLSLVGVVGCSSVEEVVQEDQSFDFEWPFSEEEDQLTFGNSSYFTNSQGKEQADELIETGCFEGVELGAVIDWEQVDELANRKIAYQLNGFKFIAPFFKAYEETRDVGYVDYATQQMLSWVEAHPNPYEGTEWGWHDDATARRVFYLTLALVLWEDVMEPRDYQVLRESLEEQVDLLTTDEFYTFNHNHGMFQDQAMVLYALALEQGNRQKELLALAKERTGSYFEDSVASDGVHQEHSPSYHYGIARNIDWFALAYQSASPSFSTQLRELSDRMANYATHLVMPDLNTPSIGDSARQVRCYQGWMEDNPFYRYALTGGEEGIRPEETSVVFKEGGYGIMRSSWEDSAETGTWMMLAAATHSGVHKHNDDLNVLLYHKGDLFVEAGSRNYDYQNPFTNYTYQSYAHNVMLVDENPFRMGENLPSIDEVAKETGIVEAELEGDVHWIKGIQKRYKGVEQVRTLTYDRLQQTVVIKDEVQTFKNETSLRFLYHLAEGIEVEEIENGWILSRQGEPVATVTVRGTGSLTLSSVYGAGDGTSPYQGLIFNGNEDPTEGYVLMIEMNAPKGESELLVDIELH